MHVCAQVCAADTHLCLYLSTCMEGQGRETSSWLSVEANWNYCCSFIKKMCEGGTLETGASVPQKTLERCECVHQPVRLQQGGSAWRPSVWGPAKELGKPCFFWQQPLALPHCWSGVFLVTVLQLDLNHWNKSTVWICTHVICPATEKGQRSVIPRAEESNKGIKNLGKRAL